MKTTLHHLFFTLVLFAGIHEAAAQGAAFTYQGQLNDGGSPANGSYGFTFALFNNSSANSGQVGNTLTNLDVGVTNGLFSVTLDFGGVFTGANYWLAIGVRGNGSANFTALNPPQALTPTPYAIYAPNSGSASSANSVSAANIVGTIPLAQLPAAVITNNETDVTLGGASITGGLTVTGPLNLPSLRALSGNVAFIGDSMSAWTNAVAIWFSWPQFLLTTPVYQNVAWANDYAVDGVTYAEMAAQILQASNEVPAIGERTMFLEGLWNDVNLGFSYATITNEIVYDWFLATNDGWHVVQIIPWEGFVNQTWTVQQSNTWTQVTNFIVTNNGPYVALVQTGYIVTNRNQTVDGLHGNAATDAAEANAVAAAYTPLAFYSLRTNSIGTTEQPLSTQLYSIESVGGTASWWGDLNLYGNINVESNYAGTGWAPIAGAGNFTADGFVWAKGGSPTYPSFAGSYAEIQYSLSVGTGIPSGVLGQINASGPIIGASFVWSTGGSVSMPSLAGNYAQINNSLGVGTPASGTLGTIQASVSVSAPDFYGNLNATNLTGTVALANLPASVVTNGGSTAANYVYAYDTTTQSTTTTALATFNHPAVQSSGWKYNSGTFTCPQTGLYLVQYTAQVSVTTGSPVNVTTFAYANDAEIPGSEVSADVITDGKTSSVTKSFIASFNVGDTLVLAFQPSSGSCQLAPSGAGATRPSLSLTIVRIQ